MHISVIGGRGFVGAAVSKTLRDAGHDVTTVDPRVGGTGHVSADILDYDALRGAVEEADAVVNMVGLSPMKEPRGVPYEDIHVTGAENVVDACKEEGVERLAHMSALGADPDASTEFLRTKGAGREAVLASDLETTVLEPSVIFDDGNELVRTARKFSFTRAFPYLRTQVQPVYRGDVAELFRMAVEEELDEDVVEVGGPEEMTLFQFVKRVYNANGYRCYPLPVQPLMVLGLYLAEPFPFVPYGADQARFLYVDNTTAKNGAEDYLDMTSVEEWLSRS